MTFRAEVRTAVVAIALMAPAVPVHAQQDRNTDLQTLNQGMPFRSDIIARDYFTARFVLANAEAIGLTEEQRSTVNAAAREAARAFSVLRFDLETAVRRLIGLSNLHPVDEEDAVEQLHQVLAIESEIKTLQLRMAIQIKNALSLEQQNTLGVLRRDARLRRQ